MAPAHTPFSLTSHFVHLVHFAAADSHSQEKSEGRHLQRMAALEEERTRLAAEKLETEQSQVVEEYSSVWPKLW